MSELVKVAHIIDVMDSGGIEAVVMNYYRHIDRKRVQFDFITSDISKIPQKEEIESLGGKIYLVPRFTQLLKFNKSLKKILKENNYDIVHCHMGTLALFPLRIAKKCGIKTRICHAHSTTNKKEWKRNLLKNILKPFSKIYATDYFACGERAGRWLFGDKFFDKDNVVIMNNAIEIDRFKYSDSIRKSVRKELEIEHNYVVGHIGRFVTQKNHNFLLEVFADVVKSRPDAVLLLIGEGPLEKEMKEKAFSLGIAEKVKFLGVRKDCDKLYQAMDVFALPSLYEGLPVVGVEAQCSGVKCVFSSETTKEILLNESSVMLDLNHTDWVEEILRESKSSRVINDFKYDIVSNANDITNYYIDLVGKK